jgi:hypothetical protein
MTMPKPILSGIGSSTSGKPRACQRVSSKTSTDPMLVSDGARVARRMQNLCG